MMDESLMHGFPPVAGSQVTLGNWRTAPYNRWAFHHVRELVPSADIANDAHRTSLFPSSLQDLSDLRVATDQGDMDWANFLGATDTDAMVVLKDGKLIYEHYDNGMQAATPHILMSISKSVLGLVAGQLEASGQLELARPITDWLPEMQSTAYAGASVRDMLDMRVGVYFNEDYLARSGPIIDYRKAQGWDPVDPGAPATDLRQFLTTLSESGGKHNTRFNYTSTTTDLMGWVIERATNERYADLVSRLLWKPMGAEQPAYITVDRLGAPRCAGGLCSTARDLARLGQLVAQNGQHEGSEVVPAAWIDDIESQGSTDAWNAGDFVEYFPGMPIHYRSKWYALRGDAPLMFCVGVFGQNLFVDRKHQLVIAKFSSHAQPMDAKRIALTMQGIADLRNYLR